MLERHLGDLQRTHEVFGLDGHTGGGAGHDGLAVLVPGDADGHVPGGHHAGDVNELPHRGRRDVEGLDEGRHWGGERKSEKE